MHINYLLILTLPVILLVHLLKIFYFCIFDQRVHSYEVQSNTLTFILIHSLLHATVAFLCWGKLGSVASI